MNPSLLFLVSILLILISSQESNASLTVFFRKLAEPKEKPIQLSPSPGPASTTNTSTGGNTTGKGSSGGDGEAQIGSTKSEPIDTVTDERCEALSKRCQEKDLTACLPNTGNGPQGSFLLIQNDGESSLKVNVTFLPVGTTLKEKVVLKHQAKKINISAEVGGIKSITLNAGQGDCVIHMGSPAPQNNSSYAQFPSYATVATYVTPIHGAYLLLITTIIVGGTWACCKCGPCSKRGRHLEGVPYQELEMGQPESLSTTNVETSDGWDQGWDDDWDEEKAVKSPSHERVGNGRANGVTTKSSNGDGWGNDWDD